ncbi:MAG: xanthine dehydrogenase family protein molybdopterin-binding subunit [Burkholderiales bacterium]
MNTILLANGIGAALPRVEDARLLSGCGHYTDDFKPQDLTYAYFVRSTHAHAHIVGMDRSDALSAPGVLAVLTAQDLEQQQIGALACQAFPTLPPGSRFHRPLQMLLASKRVRFVGECVALIVAETLQQAKDAADWLVIDYQPLPAVTLVDALADRAPKVWDEAADNLCFQLERGEGKAVDAAFSTAAHVTKLCLHYPRASANAMEPRSVLALRDPTDGRCTLYSSAQSPHHVRQIVSAVLGISEADLRVVAPDVGGGFGMKANIYPEEALVLWAAMNVGRPVKWTGERGEGLAADQHGRHQITEAAMALDSGGRILALRSSVCIDLGAYLSYSAGVPPGNALVSYSGTYHLPLVHAVVRATFTNTSPVGPYRGSGKPEASFVTERLIDKASREMGIDVIEMRRRNLIAQSAMPYRTPGGNVYDCGNFEAVLDGAIQLSNWHGFAARRAVSEQQGLLRGIGLAMHCQRAGNQSERMEIRMASNGSVGLYVGTLSTGQGHETMFAQMACEWLGVPIDQVRVFQGDTDKSIFGRGTFAQRSMIAGGSALKRAAEALIDKGQAIAAWMLEASTADIEFAGGVFSIKGTDRGVTLAEVAKKSYQGIGLPEAFGVGLDGVGSHPGPNTYPNGCMICEVEVDAETGSVKVARLVAVDDTGTVINPMTLEGQLHGSVAQGLGEALMEEVVYDKESGQLLSGSFMDYAMPRADDMPHMVSALAPVPTMSNLLGVKGGSEAGNVGAPAAIANAIIDALSAWHVADIALPATPERIWRAINSRKKN